MNPPFISRRTALGSGLVMTALAPGVSGCSAALPNTGILDPESADRALITQALSASVNLAALCPSIPAAASLKAIHQHHITRFSAVGSLRSPTASAARTLSSADLTARERAHIAALQKLALSAQRGEVAALLASAAAGVQQALTRYSG